MKKILPIILFVFIFFFFPSFVRAGDSNGVESNRNCIDLKAVYEEANATSQAITGQEKSLDAMKKAENIASLTNILSLFLGDGIFCVNDKEAAVKSISLKSTGLFGYLDSVNYAILAGFPSTNVLNHLAQEFVPGYSKNNTTLAQVDCGPQPSYNDYEAYLDWYDCRLPQPGAGKTSTGTQPTTTTPSTTSCGTMPSRNDYEAYRKYVECQQQLQGGGTNQEEGEEMGNVNERLQKKLKLFTQNDQTVSKIEAQVAGESVANERQKGFDYLRNLKVDLLWGETRNIAYLFFVIVMIVAGFMIMFRKNLPGQVVVSIGNSIPRIVISLILVTFSFAIVGLMLDIGRIGMSVVNNTLAVAERKVTGATTVAETDISGVGRLTDQALYHLEEKSVFDPNLEGVDSIEEAENIVSNNEGVGKTSSVTTRIGFGVLLSMLLQAARETETTALPAVGATGLLEVVIDLALAAAQYFTLASVARLILFLLVALYASVRLFITMFTTYIKIIVSVVVAPLQIAVGSIPGNESMTINWFKSAAANVLVFVVIVAILGFFRFMSSAIDPSRFNFFGNKGLFFPEWLIQIKGILIIASYLFASNAPTLVNGFMNVEQNKVVSVAGENIKNSMSKIPLVGSMFNG